MSKANRGRVTAPAPTPLDAQRMDDLRKVHRPEDPASEDTVCQFCYRVWPCTISRLLVMIPEASDG